MCLNADRNATETLRRRMRKNGRKITVWKEVRKRGGVFVTPYRGVVVKPGWMISNRTMSKLHFRSQLSAWYLNNNNNLNPNNDEYDSGKMIILVNLGIHVYTDKKEAYNITKNRGENIISCTAYIDDLVGAGVFTFEKSAVFNKIFISKKNYNRALKRVK
jgi:hypothetical protein